MKKILSLINTTVLMSVMLISAPTAVQASNDVVALKNKLVESQERLNLSEKQQQQMLAILDEQAIEQDKILKRYGVDLENTDKSQKLSFKQIRSMRIDMRNLKEETKKKISNVLTPEQIKEWQSLRHENLQSMKSHYQSSLKV